MNLARVVKKVRIQPWAGRYHDDHNCGCKFHYGICNILVSFLVSQDLTEQFFLFLVTHAFHISQQLRPIVVSGPEVELGLGWV